MKNYCVYCTEPMQSDRCNCCGKGSDEYCASSHHLPPGTILNQKYYVGAVLGEGGFGITYIGRDLTLDMPVAIKEYFPFGSVTRNNTSSDAVTANTGTAGAQFEKGKQSFLTEARTLAKFSEEANCVSVRDFFAANNTAYIVMEYLEGMTLADYVEKHGVCSFADMMHLMDPIMKLLEKMHAKGVIHRDISPANIMYLGTDRVKLLDFGAARMVEREDERSRSILLKPGYAPEEQYRSKGVQGPWTDIYALSATMYKLLTGITPEDAMNRLFADELKPIQQLNSSITPEQEAVIQKGMSVMQNQRYQTIAEMRSACKNALLHQVASSANGDAERTVAGFSAGDVVATKSKRSAEAAPVTPVPDPVIPERNTKAPDSGISDSLKRAQQEAQETVANTTTKTTKKKKKPNLAAWIGSILTTIGLYLSGIYTIDYWMNKYESALVPGIISFVLLAATLVLGWAYYPRVDHQEKKPNKISFALSILTTLGALYFFCIAFVGSQSGNVGERFLPNTMFTGMILLCFTAMFSFFFYPRLTRTGKKRFLGAYAGSGAIIVAGIIAFITFTVLGSVTIGDQNIKKDAVSVNLSLDIITDKDLEKLKTLKKLENLSLSGSFMDDNDMKIIGECTTLQTLYLTGDTDVTDVSPLNNLTELTVLGLNGTSVTDISCLDQLKKLKTLKISLTDVSDLTCLTMFPELYEIEMNSLSKLDPKKIALPDSVVVLSCANNDLQDLAFASNCEQLKIVYAPFNQISDLSPVCMEGVQEIDLSHNQVTDISPLEGSEWLRDLNLSHNQISDITPLGDCERIWNLKLNDNQISDITPLQNLMQLGVLNVAYNDIQDITALQDHARLTRLYINHNRIKDISSLQESFQIEKLDISENQIVELGVLANMENLETLNAYDNQISDISVFAQCEQLKHMEILHLQKNNIQDISVLSEFSELRVLSLHHNQIQDISPLASCENLSRLIVPDNQIQDLSPLIGNKQLVSLQAPNNPITDLHTIFTADKPFNSENVTYMHVSYCDTIDWTEFPQESRLTVKIYDVPELEKVKLEKIGRFRIYFGDSEDIYAEEDEIESEEDEEGFVSEETEQADE